MQLRGLVVHNGFGDADLKEPIEKFSRQNPPAASQRMLTMRQPDLRSFFLRENNQTQVVKATVGVACAALQRKARRGAPTMVSIAAL